jgi:hypothetical protein
MKKLYFSILSAIVGLSLNAQTLTQANHAPIVGDMFGTKQCDSTGVNPGASGSGVIWTFTNVVVHPSVTNYTGVTTASTGSNTSYPSSAVSVSAGPNKNSFYSSTVNSLMYWGGDVSLGALGAILTYTGTQSAMAAKYPMGLGTTTTVPVSGTLTVSGNNGTFSGSCTATADGTGTLKLPSGVTFSNCIRVMTQQNITFNVIVSGTVVQTKYEWYNAVSKAPLFAISSSSISSLAGNSSQTVVTIASNYITLGVKESLTNSVDLSVYPNPAKDNLTISYYNENGNNASYQVLNALGQVIKQDNLGSDKGIIRSEISIETLPSGIYFVKVMVGDRSTVEKITVQ